MHELDAILLAVFEHDMSPPAQVPPGEHGEF